MSAASIYPTQNGKPVSTEDAERLSDLIPTLWRREHEQERRENRERRRKLDLRLRDLGLDPPTRFGYRLGYWAGEPEYDDEAAP
jgi:hypothetical protein